MLRNYVIGPLTSATECEHARKLLKLMGESVRKDAYDDSDWYTGMIFETCRGVARHPRWMGSYFNSKVRGGTQSISLDELKALISSTTSPFRRIVGGI